MATGTLLLLYAAIAICALIVLIARYRLNPFITLTLVSLGLALAAGMPAGEIVAAYEQGVGRTLGHIALIVALGTMLGKMMAESGGAERIARTLIAWFGVKHVHWAMMLVAFGIGLPIFFEVGFVLLVPIVFNVARRTGVPLLLVGLPMVAGLSVVHGLVPPHPAAMLAVKETRPTSARPCSTRCWSACRPRRWPGRCSPGSSPRAYGCRRTTRWKRHCWMQATAACRTNSCPASASPSPPCCCRWA